MFLTPFLLRLFVSARSYLFVAVDAFEHSVRTRRRAETGQATAEYALVLLGAAVVAIALITWATTSGRVGRLFDRVFDELQRRL